MGFWSSIGSFLKSGAKEGGEESLKSRLLKTGLDFAGSLAQGRETGRAADNASAMAQDTQRLTAGRDYDAQLMDRAKLDLDRQKFSQDAQDNDYKNALRSSLLLNLKDFSFDLPKGVTQWNIQGGLRPSAIGDDARKAAEIMSARALVGLMDGRQYTDVPDPEKFTPSEMKQGNALDTVLGAAGALGKAATRTQAEDAQNEQSSLIRKLIDAARQDADRGLDKRPTLGLQQFG